MSNIVRTTDADFDSVVSAATLPVVAIFSATWCKACTKLHPLCEELANKYKDRLLFVKHDVNNNMLAAKRHNVQGLPTVVTIDQDVEKERFVGNVDKAAFEAVLSTYLKKE